MNYKLTLQERMNILSILPKNSNIITLKLVFGLQNKLGVSEKEYKEFEIKINDNGNYTYKKEANILEKEFELTDVEILLIKEELSKLNNKNDLPIEFIKIYEKVM